MNIVIQFGVAFVLLGVVIILVLRKVMFTSTDSSVVRLNQERLRLEKKQKELDEKTRLCEEECKQRVALANGEAAKIKNDFLLEAEQEKKRMLDKARAQSEEIMQKASESVVKLKKDVMKSADLKAVDFAIQIIMRGLRDTGVMKLSEDIIEAFLSEIEKVETNYVADCKKIEVIFSHKMPELYMKKIKEVLGKKVSQDAEFVEKIDPAIVGGVMLKFGTMILDGSLVAKLRESTEIVKKETEAK